MTLCNRSLSGAVAAAFATKDTYGSDLYNVFKERRVDHMDASKNGTNPLEMDSSGGRTAGEQAAVQAAVLAITLVMAIVGGRRRTSIGLYRVMPLLQASSPECSFDGNFARS